MLTSSFPDLNHQMEKLPWHRFPIHILASSCPRCDRLLECHWAERDRFFRNITAALRWEQTLNRYKKKKKATKTSEATLLLLCGGQRLTLGVFHLAFRQAFSLNLELTSLAGLAGQSLPPQRWDHKCVSCPPLTWCPESNSGPHAFMPALPSPQFPCFLGLQNNALH